MGQLLLQQVVLGRIVLSHNVLVDDFRQNLGCKVLVGFVLVIVDEGLQFVHLHVIQDAREVLFLLFQTLESLLESIVLPLDVVLGLPQPLSGLIEFLFRLI